MRYTYIKDNVYLDNLKAEISSNFKITTLLVSVDYIAPNITIIFSDTLDNLEKLALDGIVDDHRGIENVEQYCRQYITEPMESYAMGMYYDSRVLLESTVTKKPSRFEQMVEFLKNNVDTLVMLIKGKDSAQVSIISKLSKTKDPYERLSLWATYRRLYDQNR